MAAIQLENVELRDDSGRVYLEKLDCTFSRGELSLVSGVHASGKSALLRLLGGRIRPSSGTIRRDSRVAFADQEPRFLGSTIAEDFAISWRAAGLAGKEIPRRLPELLSWAGLPGRENADPRWLSGGERRLFSIGVALNLDCDFVVLDEPFAFLDTASVRKVLESILELSARGLGVILASQDIEKVLAHVQRLILLKQGRVIADALPDRVLPYLEEHGLKVPKLKLAEMTWLR